MSEGEAPFFMNARQGSVERGQHRLAAEFKLALAGGAIEGRAAGLHDAADFSLAAGAGFAFPIIDAEVMLEITELAVVWR